MKNILSSHLIKIKKIPFFINLKISFKQNKLTSVIIGYSALEFKFKMGATLDV